MRTAFSSLSCDLFSPLYTYRNFVLAQHQAVQPPQYSIYIAGRARPLINIATRKENYSSFQLQYHQNMRTASGGKFSLGSAFGRRPDKHERQASYTGSEFGAEQGSARGTGGAYNDQPDSPNATTREGGSGGTQLKKLGKTFAHNNLLPGLGNKDLKALQE